MRFFFFPLQVKMAINVLNLQTNGIGFWEIPSLQTDTDFFSWETLYTINYLYKNLRPFCYALVFFHITAKCHKQLKADYVQWERTVKKSSFRMQHPRCCRPGDKDSSRYGWGPGKGLRQSRNCVELEMSATGEIPAKWLSGSGVEEGTGPEVIGGMSVWVGFVIPLVTNTKKNILTLGIFHSIQLVGHGGSWEIPKHCKFFHRSSE
jgi:hypothetical protein